MKELFPGELNTREPQSTKTFRPQHIGNAPTVRTLRTDAVELIQEKGIPEKHSAERYSFRSEYPLETAEEHTPLGRIIFLLILVLTFGIGVGLYALIGTRTLGKRTDIATTTAPVASPTLENIGIIISDSPREQILADISITFGKTSLPSGNTREIIFFTKDSTGTSKKASSEEFINAITYNGSRTSLISSLGTNVSFEIYSGTSLSGVISVPSRFYAETFADMLDWEKNMMSDLVPAVNPWYDRKSIQQLIGRPFKDEFVSGNPVRILSDMSGKTVIVYGFFEKKILVVAGSKDSLDHTFQELSKENPSENRN